MIDCWNFIEKSINSILDRCVNYNKTADYIFEFVFPVNIYTVLDEDADLGNLIINRPEEAFEAIRQTLFAVIQEGILITNCKHPRQITIKLVVHGLPNFNYYNLQKNNESTYFKDKDIEEPDRKAIEYGINFETPNNYEGNNTSVVKNNQLKQLRSLIQYKGIVTGVSTKHKYLKNTKYNCKTCFGESYTFIQVLDNKPSRNELTCAICDQMMHEDVTARVLNDRVFFELVDTQYITKMNVRCNEASVIECVTACARDELSSRLKIGLICEVIGVWCYDHKKKVRLIEILSLKPIERIYPSIIVDSLMDGFPSIPSNIKNLFFLCYQQSPFSFFLKITCSIYKSRSSNGDSYTLLKIILLLSLVSKCNQEFQGIDILSVGVDDRKIDYIMTSFLSLDLLGIKLHHKTPSLLPTLNDRKDKYSVLFIRGSDMMVCNKGVCFLPDLLNLKKSHQDVFMSILDTNNISYSIPIEETQNKEANTYFKQPNTIREVHKRTCRVWSYATPSSKITSYVASYFKMFCLVVKAGDKNGDDVNIWKYTDDFDQKKHNLFQISSNDIKEFLSYIRNSDIFFSSSAEQLLQGYYLAMRRSRAQNSIVLTSKTIKTITCMAESIGKLLLRSTITINEAVIAIWLYELTLLDWESAAVLNEFDRNITWENYNFDYFKKFKLRLFQFLSLYSITVSEDFE